MIARALAVLGGATLTPDERAAGGLGGLERAVFTGSGETWEAAKSAAGIPDDALVLHWFQEE